LSSLIRYHISFYLSLVEALTLQHQMNTLY